MDFGSPALLIFLVAAALALATGLWTLRWRARQVERMLREGGGDLAPPSQVRGRLLALGVVVLALLLLALAAARPQVGSRDTEVRQTGIAVAIVFDVSLSMAAQDVPPSRFALAQQEVDGLLDRLQGNRVGLVLFAGDAFVRFPLTRDIDVAREIIAALEPGESFVGRGTNIDAAIEAGQSLLEDSSAATRAILVISDGESFGGQSLLAASAAAADGLRLFSAGAGTPDGATIPVEQRSGGPTPQLDVETGLPIISRADFPALIALAEAGRGRFVRLTEPGALAALSVDFDSLESSTFAVEIESVPTERFQIFAGIALLLLVLELLWPARRRFWPRPSGRGIALVSLILATGIVATACASAAYSRNADGNAAYEDGNFAAALSFYRSAQAEAPDDFGLHLNAGRALHSLGQFERAEAETIRAAAADDVLLVSRAFYNAGNHRLSQGDLQGARNAYIEALLRNPSDGDAKFNLELVNGLLLAQLQPPGTQQSDSGPEGDPGDESAASEGGGAAAPSADADATQIPSGEEDTADNASGTGSASPGETIPGAREGAGTESDPAGDEESAVTVAEQIQEALSALDRDEPTLEQALAILDVLRQRMPRDPISTGGQPPVSIEADER